MRRCRRRRPRATTCPRRWPAGASATGPSAERARTERSFVVPVAEIEAAGWDLSLNRYREVEHGEEEHRPVAEILADLRAAEAEIASGLEELEAMLARPAEAAE